MENPVAVSGEDALNLYIENQEQRLKKLLEQMAGVGKIQVMIRAGASKEYVVEKDVTTSTGNVNESDSQGEAVRAAKAAEARFLYIRRMAAETMYRG